MLLALALAATLIPQGITGCGKCHKTGTIPCKGHTELEHAFEKDVLFCSVAASCELCKGAMFLDCPRCESGPTSEAVAAAPARIADWMKRTEVEEHLDRSVPRIETERFQLIIDTGIRRSGRKKKVDSHTLAHWIARDVEKVAGLVAEHYDAKPDDYDAKMRMWVAF